MEVYVKNGEVLKDPPPEGSYAGVVQLHISEATALKFFSNALDLYSLAKHFYSSEGECLSVRAVSSDILEVLNHLAEVSDCTAIFESYYNPVKEIRDDG